MTTNAIAQISAKVAMADRFLDLVGTLPPPEQFLWYPNQAVQDPDTLGHYHTRFNSNMNTRSSRIMNHVSYESYTVQDNSATLRIQELPQPGKSRPVLPPSQRTLCRQIMKFWEPWKVTVGSSQNNRMLVVTLPHSADDT